MCNSLNHHPSCTCGFGGIGHLGRRESGTNYGLEEKWRPSISHSYESYVNPNALCPVCNAAVFFYQSPNGGKVFFEELGPPWTKHPCTDGSSIQKNTGPKTSPSFRPENTHIYKWQKEGWSPFFMTIVSGVDNNCLRITGIFNDKELTLYIERIVNPHGPNGNANPIAKESLAHLKKSTEQRYELSLVTIFGKSITVNAFLSLSDARPDQSTPSTPPKVKLLTDKQKAKLTRESNKRNTQASAKVSGNNAAKANVGAETPKKAAKKQSKGAIALALEEAIKKQELKLKKKQ